jgi:uncharacterized membrane protein
MRKALTPRTHFLLALVVATLATFGLFLARALRNNSWEYNYLVWNLFLAWLPLVFALRLVIVLRAKLWSSWEAVILSVLWLLFLPNSFYMISDFIHLERLPTVDLLQDAVMITAFVYLSLTIGFSSLYLVHLEFKKRFSPRWSALFISVFLLLASLAIYTGRDLRRNSWDVLANPAGLLFDFSDRLLNPSGYGQIAVTVLSFFALLGSMYTVLWCGARLIRRNGDTHLL